MAVVRILETLVLVKDVKSSRLHIVTSKQSRPQHDTHCACAFTSLRNYNKEGWL